MGYYQGDHYRRGDYYRGDPGFLSGLGKAIGKVAKLAAPIASFIPGVGPLLGAGLGAVVKAPEAGVEVGQKFFGKAPAAPPGAGLPPGAPPPGMGLVGPMPGMAVAMHVRKMHANRSTYITRGGGTSRWPVGIQVHPKGTEAVPSRRMNVANPRALRRALRRAHGFATLARRFIAVTHRFKKKRRGRR